MKRMFRSAMLLCLLVVMSGCATMFTEKTQKLSFKTKPEKAEVAVGVKTCITPCTLEVEKGKWQIHVMVTKPGYEPQSTALAPKIEPWYWANFLNLGFGMIVDVITGTAIKYEPEYYIPLTRRSGSVAADYSDSYQAPKAASRSFHPPKEPKVVQQDASPKEVNTPQSTNTSSEMHVIGYKSKLRKTASAKAGAIKTLKKGEKVKFVKQKNEWCLIELASGEVGWCQRKDLADKN